MRCDVLVVGAGLSGLVAAERLSSVNRKNVIIIDKRKHIGGNCYDYYNSDGLLVHKYGPHYFRTNSKRVFDYLSNFTEWIYQYYKVKASVQGNLVDLPISIATINSIYGTSLSIMDIDKFVEEIREKKEEINNSEDAVLNSMGRLLYDLVFRNYTKKQWDLYPSELDRSICERIGIRKNKDSRFLTEKYQAMPKDGYTEMFNRMIKGDRIRIILGVNYNDIKNEIASETTIYTGRIDEFFDYKYGELPYRSLRFEHQTVDEEFYQSVGQINYPNEYDFTRIVEIKHVTKQKHHKSTIVREYSDSEGEPYYPIINDNNNELYAKYELDALRERKVLFTGRLALYKYLNMDQVVDASLSLVSRYEQ